MAIQQSTRLKICAQCGAEFLKTKNPDARFCSKRCVGFYRGRRPIADRLWSKVDKSAGPDGCWPWTGAKSATGYGAFGHTRAHRVAFAVTHGPIPSGILVCHHCDNRACCNPAHLFAGTNKDNTADMAAKGRAKFRRTGRSNGRSKFSDEVIAAIRSATDYRAVAAQHGVSLRYAHNVRRGIYRSDHSA